MNTTNSNQPVKWAATAEVAPHPGNSLLGAATGAYVAVVGLAGSEPEFCLKVKLALNAMDFELLEIEDIKQIDSMLEMGDFDPVLRERAFALHEGNPIELGTFHAFSE